MLTVLFSWVVICAASLLFGKAIVDSVYKNRLETMGRPDVYIVTGILFLNVYAQFFSLFYKVAGIAPCLFNILWFRRRTLCSCPSGRGLYSINDFSFTVFRLSRF